MLLILMIKILWTNQYHLHYNYAIRVLCFEVKNKFPGNFWFCRKYYCWLASCGGGALWMEHEYSPCFWLPCLFLCFSFLGNKLKTRFTWQKKKECSWKITVRIWLFSECWPSSETQGQLVGSIKCLWWKFIVRSSRSYSELSPRTFYRPD